VAYHTSIQPTDPLISSIFARDLLTYLFTIIDNSLIGGDKCMRFQPFDSSHLAEHFWEDPEINTYLSIFPYRNRKKSMLSLQQLELGRF